MPVSDQYRCLFVHIPKTGGTSIEKALGMFRDRSDQEDACAIFGKIELKATFPVAPVSDYLQHLTLQEALFFNREGPRLHEYFKFTWIRNPWDRMVSAFSNKDQNLLEMARNQGIELEGATFDEFVAMTGTIRHSHLMPMSHYLQPGESGMGVDFIGRFENFETDFERLCSLIGARVPLPHENRSAHDHYRKYYSDWSRIEVAKRYELDVELFGYCF
jgi:chondroitin 4-sulfotransferase 11